MRIILIVLTLLGVGVPSRVTVVAPAAAAGAEPATVRAPAGASHGERAAPGARSITRRSGPAMPAPSPTKPPGVTTFIPLQGEALERALKAVAAKRAAALAHPALRAEPRSSLGRAKPPDVPAPGTGPGPGPSPGQDVRHGRPGPARPATPATGR